jgi:hypothetical protein
MIAHLNVPETDSATAALDGSQIPPASASESRMATVLRSLAHDWEHDCEIEDESETELMVLLSGMVNAGDPIGDA